MAKKRKFTAADIAALRTSLNEGRVTELPLDLVEADPGQPRRTFNDASLQDLAADIARNGVLQPITVDHTDKGWQIVMGERRWRAAVSCALKTIPALLATSTLADGAATPEWMLERRLQQFAENHHRDPLPPMDLAYFLRSLRDDLGLSATQIAASLKDRGVREMGRSYVSNTIRLTELPARYQALISDGKLAPTSGKYLLMLEGLGEAGFAALDDHLVPELDALDAGERITSPDVQRLVGGAFYQLGCRLDEGAEVSHNVVNALMDEGLPHTWDIVFDRAECKSCPKRQPYTTVNGKQQIWCLDPAAFLQKQRAALKAIQAGAPVPELVEVELDLGDPGGPDGEDEGAPEMPPGFTSPDKREESLRAKVHDHLVKWMRPRIVAVFNEEPLARSMAFVLWAALSFPRARNWSGEPGVECAQSWQMRFDTKALAGELLMVDPVHAGALSVRDLERKVRAYVNACVEFIDAPSVWRWAIALDLAHLSGYDLTQGYFDCCDKAEVEILARELGVRTSSGATKGKMVTAILAAQPEHVPRRVYSVLGTACRRHKETVASLDALESGPSAAPDDADQQAAA